VLLSGREAWREQENGQQSFAVRSAVNGIMRNRDSMIEQELERIEKIEEKKEHRVPPSA
jgi:hypothetical protein